MKVIEIPDGTAKSEIKVGEEIKGYTYYFFHCRRDNISAICTDSQLLDRVRNRPLVPVLCPACMKSMKLGRTNVMNSVEATDVRNTEVKETVE